MAEMSPRVWGLILGIASLVVFASFVAAGWPEQGKIAAFSTFALSVAVRIRWDRRKSSAFVPIVAALIAAHLFLVLGVHWSPERNPAALFSPFAIADIFIMAWVIGRAAPES
jgi:hypothetical protein